MFRHAEIRWSATFSHSHKCLGAVPMPIEYPRITLWLWLTVCHGFSMALIEIDDFPSERSRHLFWGFSMAMLNHRFFFQPTHHVSRLETSHHQHRFLWHVWLGSAWTSRAVVVVVPVPSRPPAASRCSEANAPDVCVPWRVEFGSIWCDLAVSKPIVPLFCSHQNSWDLWMWITH